MKKKLITVAALLLFALAVSAFRYQAGQRWEYKVTTVADIDDRNADGDLNLAGGGGWELVTVERNAKGRTYFFKRPK